MGWDLYQGNARFKQIVDEANDLCNQMTGVSFLELLFDKSKGMSVPFDYLAATHPALFTIQYAVCKIAMEKYTPDLLIGGSLGELIALSIAEAISFEEALQFVTLQTQLFESSCNSGIMVALFCEMNEVETLIESSVYPLFLAASGSLKSCTLALSHEHFEEFENELKKREILYQRLPVNSAFHSPLIEEAKKAFLFLASRLRLECPKVPVASCVTKDRIEKLDAFHIWNVVREPVFLKETLLAHLDPEEDFIIDFSPQGTHVAIAKELFGNTSLLVQNSHKTLTPFQTGQKNMEKLLTC